MNHFIFNILPKLIFLQKLMIAFIKLKSIFYYDLPYFLHYTAHICFSTIQHKYVLACKSKTCKKSCGIYVYIYTRSVQKVSDFFV